MLLGFFPTLSLALIHKVIAFYLENQAEVDAYVAHCEAESERHHEAAPPRRRSKNSKPGGSPGTQSHRRKFGQVWRYAICVWFDDPKKESVCEETDDDVVLVKDRDGRLSVSSGSTIFRPGSATKA